jgi:hypothetical protein
MKRVTYNWAALCIFPILALPLESKAQQEQLECASKTTRVKAVSTQSVNRNAFNFTSALHPGALDPTPLLTTTVKTGGKVSCLIAHFSAYARPADNHLIFQVRVDGQPMEGHAPGFAGFGVPVVTEPNSTDIDVFDLPRMATYNFFKEVGPGEHTVEVRLATCCGDPAGELGPVIVDAAVLTLEYK